MKGLDMGEGIDLHVVLFLQEFLRNNFHGVHFLVESIANLTNVSRHVKGRRKYGKLSPTKITLPKAPLMEKSVEKGENCRYFSHLANQF